MIIDMFGFKSSILFFIFCVSSLLFVPLFLVSFLFLGYLDFDGYISFRLIYWLLVVALEFLIFQSPQVAAFCILSRIFVVIGERDRLSWADLILAAQILPFQKCDFGIFLDIYIRYCSFKITGFVVLSISLSSVVCFSPK